jgi:hypothetical protein
MYYFIAPNSAVIARISFLFRHAPVSWFYYLAIVPALPRISEYYPTLICIMLVCRINSYTGTPIFIFSRDRVQWNANIGEPSTGDIILIFIQRNNISHRGYVFRETASAP